MNAELISVLVGTVAGLALPPVLLVSAARAGRNGGARDRRALADAALTALLGVLLSRALIPWHVVPPLLWAIPVAVTAYGLWLAARAWPALPWLTGKNRSLAVLGTALTLVITAAAALTVA